MPDNLLEVRNLTKHFGGLAANSGLNIDVPRGGIVGIIGPNGSGKTTLFNCITGQHALDAGSIRFDGREISRQSMAQIARLGLIRTFQQTQIFDGLNCLQNMQMAVSHARESRLALFERPAIESEARARELLEFAGLRTVANNAARNLSFGQRKLLEFAMALMGNPKLLLLDEPSAGINPSHMNEIAGLLRRTRQTLGISMLVIEHNVRLLASLSDHIYCLAHGRLLAQGAPGEIQSDPLVIDAYLGAR